MFGAVEEVSEEESCQQMEVNFFELLWITQAVLPYMRTQKSGRIIQVFSVLNLFLLSALGHYNVSAFAVEGPAGTLASDVKAFGIYVSLTEPHGYETECGSNSASRTWSLRAFDNLIAAFHNGYNPAHYSVSAATIDAILTLIDAPESPLRLLLGKIGYPTAEAIYEQRLATWAACNKVSGKVYGKQGTNAAYT